MGSRLALLVVLTLLAPAAWAKVSFNFGGAGGGSIRPGDDSTMCSSTIAGAIRYNSGALGYCNGTVWTPLAAGGTSGTTVAAGVSGSIQFNSGGALAGRSDLLTDTFGNIMLGSGTSAGRVNLIKGDASNTGYIDFLNASGSRVGYMGYANTVLPIFASSGTAITFNPSNTEAVRIQPNGNMSLTNFGRTLNVANSDTFTYNGQSMSQYGLGWFGDSTDGWNAQGPTAWLAAYSGIKFFTLGLHRMSITPSGRVGIGTTNPSDILHVAGGNVRIDNGTNAAFTIWSGAGLFGGLGSANVIDGGGSSDPALFSAGAGRNLRFYTNGAERVRILDNGNVGISTSPASNHRFEVNSPYDGVYSVSTNNSWSGVVGQNSPGGSSGLLGYAGWGVYCQTGTCGGTANWQNTSDIRLKERVETLPNSRGLAVIDKLRPVTYHWKDKKRDAKEGQQIGFIAQEVEKLYPEIVLTDPNTTIKTMAYSEITAPLVKAVQEQQAQIRILKADNNLMRRQLNAVCKATRACW